MSAHTFLNSSIHTYREKEWLKYSDVCPYNVVHASFHKKHLLRFAYRKWFIYYCSGGKRPGKKWYQSKGTASDKIINKLVKFYWKIHPTERWNKVL